MVASKDKVVPTIAGAKASLEQALAAWNTYRPLIQGGLRSPLMLSITFWG